MFEASIQKITEIVKDKLKHLSPHLSYHSIDHTLDVVVQSEKLAFEEGITDERELYLLKVAALYHDTGFLKTYKNHEVVSCEIFMQDAPEDEFSEEEKMEIKGMIMATKLPQQPKTHLEQILCDADLDYLGRDDFAEVAENLRKEFVFYGIVESVEEWEVKQLDFLNHHTYHTKAARRLRESKKQMNIGLLV